MYIDFSYFIFCLPALILSIIAQIKVKSTFSKYLLVPSSANLTGREAAKKLLDYSGLSDVRIEKISGGLTDHYDPVKNVLRLSADVYDNTSISSIAVACHEAGHAVQKNTGYKPLFLRSSLVPIANIGSSAGPWLFIIGLFMQLKMLQISGIVLFSAAVLFYLITLPVEFNASKRALVLLEETSIIAPDEKIMAKEVLTSAAMTYVASALVALSNLLRLIFISRRRD